MERDTWDAKHKCMDCDSVMKKKELIIEGMKVRGWECSKCDETVLHSEDAQKMLVFNKLKKGLQVKIGELGQSLIIRLPKEAVDFYNINKGGYLTLKAENMQKMELDL